MYIGNQPSQIAFVTDTFSGNGSTTAFTMSVAPANTASVLVAVSGVLQDPSTYSVSGTTLTFSAAPPSATGNISCRYLGIPASGVTTTAYRTVTEFTATAGQTVFTPPSYTVGFINVYQNGALLGSADYTATNGTTVVLTSAAALSDLVTVESFLVSSVLNAIPSVGGSISNLYLDVGNQNGTGAVLLPSGTTAQRPSAATAGQLRYNSTTGLTEVYQGGVWSPFTTGLYVIEYVVVAGGGGGGRYGGGGGAGGYRSSVSGESSGGGASAEASLTVVSGSTYAVTIGAGGAGATSRSVNGATGSSSALAGISSTGGGGAGSDTAGGSGSSGGSGGGCAYNSSSTGAGTAGQGYAGGAGVNVGPNYGTGGGGGAGAVGTAGTSTAGGNGGVGIASSITGTSVYRAGGGGGQSQGGTQGSGGNGGGGAGANGTAATNGSANTGGGGGGTSDTTPGTGGSGVVIIRYQGGQRGTGGSVTSAGGYTIHTFNSSGTFTA